MKCYGNNGSSYTVLKSLSFGVQPIALSIEVNDLSDVFSIDTDWNSLSVDYPEMASFKNAFFVRAFSCFTDEVRRFKGLAWLNSMTEYRRDTIGFEIEFAYSIK